MESVNECGTPEGCETAPPTPTAQSVAGAFQGLFGGGPEYEAKLKVARAINDLLLALERGEVGRERLRREFGL